MSVCVFVCVVCYFVELVSGPLLFLAVECAIRVIVNLHTNTERSERPATNKRPILQKKNNSTSQQTNIKKNRTKHTNEYTDTQNIRYLELAALRFDVLISTVGMQFEDFEVVFAVRRPEASERLHTTHTITHIHTRTK